MKYRKINIPLYLFVVAALLMAASCKKSFYSKVNDNPNAPLAANIVPSVLLSTVEGTLAYTQGGDFSRYTSLILQQTLGASRQAQGYYGYTFTSVDFDAVWGNTYTSVMENNITMMQLCDAKGYNFYGGISRILMAYTLQLAVDQWGNIPYSDALTGALNLQPKYDVDKVLYDTITNLITTAIAQINNPSPGVLSPGGEDIVFGGSAKNWIKFAHAIQARLYLHQSKGSAAMAGNVLTEIAQSFTSNSDNAQYVFGSTQTSANPWYQFNQQRTDISFSGSPMGRQMIAAHDPRLPILIDTTTASGGDGLLYYGNINSPVEFITYDELLFAKAEATLRASGDVPTAQGIYQAAITANMQKLGVAAGDIATYLAAHGTLPAAVNDAIAKVASQAYYGLYLNPEAFATWRRTGSPTINPIVGQNVPRRFLYPQTEYSYNAANVPASVTLFTPTVFWDK